MAGAFVGESGPEAILPLRYLDRVNFHSGLYSVGSSEIEGIVTGQTIDQWVGFLCEAEAAKAAA